MTKYHSRNCKICWSLKWSSLHESHSSSYTRPTLKINNGRKLQTFLKVGMFIEASMESGMKNFDRQGYKGVTETWNVLQHDVSNVKKIQDWNFRMDIHWFGFKNFFQDIAKLYILSNDTHTNFIEIYLSFCNSIQKVSVNDHSPIKTLFKVLQRKFNINSYV